LNSCSALSCASVKCPRCPLRATRLGTGSRSCSLALWVSWPGEQTKAKQTHALNFRRRHPGPSLRNVLNSQPTLALPDDFLAFVSATSSRHPKLGLESTQIDATTSSFAFDLASWDPQGVRFGAVTSEQGRAADNTDYTRATKRRCARGGGGSDVRPSEAELRSGSPADEIRERAAPCLYDRYSIDSKARP
jgi:hypothetical protein